MVCSRFYSLHRGGKVTAPTFHAGHPQATPRGSPSPHPDCPKADHYACLVGGLFALTAALSLSSIAAGNSSNSSGRPYRVADDSKGEFRLVVARRSILRALMPRSAISILLSLPDVQPTPIVTIFADPRPPATISSIAKPPLTQLEMRIASCDR